MSASTATAGQASAPQLRDSPQRFPVAAMLFAGMFICYAQRGALAIAAPFLMNEMGFTKATMGLLLSGFFWSYLLMQVPSGTLTDRLGPRRVYGWGMIASGIACAIAGVATGLWSLITTRVLLGVGQAVSFPASSRSVASWFRDEERGGVTALYLCGVRFGQAAVTFVGVGIIAAYGWKFLFAVVGAAAIVWALPWLLFLRRWERPAAVTGRPAPGLLAGLGLLRQRSALGIFLGFFAFNYAWNMYTNWLPGYLSLERKFTNQDVAFYSSVPFVAMAGVILLSGFFSDLLVRRGLPELRVRKAFVIVGLLLGCLIVPAGFVEDRMASVWLLMLSLCGLGVASPNTWTLTQTVCPKSIAGTAAGVQNLGGNLGAALAPLLAGFVAEATSSFAMALAITGGVLVLGALAYGTLVGPRVSAE